MIARAEKSGHGVEKNS